MVSFIFILTFPMLSFSECCVCVCVFIYIISIGMLCVSREELSLIESNQQIYMWLLQANNFWKTKTLWDFEKVIFHSSKLLIQCNTNFCCAYITGVVNTYLHSHIFTRVSLLIPVCVVSLCVCVISKSTSKQPLCLRLQ